MSSRALGPFLLCLVLAGCGSSGGYGRRLPLDGGALDAAGEPPGDSAMGGGGDDLAAVESACGSVPSGGLCIGDSQVQRCIVPTGQGTPKVIISGCQSYEMCQVVDGIAQCIPRPGQCAPGASRCDGANARDVCVGGRWQMAPCDNCTDTGFGTICGMNASTTRIGLTIKYEAYAANQAWNDWAPQPFLALGQGVLVVSYTRDRNKNQDAPLDSAVTDSNGKVMLNVPSNPGPDDSIIIWAVGSKPGGLMNGMAYALAIPDVPDGEWNIDQPIPAGNQARFWGWQYSMGGLFNGATVTISAADGSGAMRIFDYVRYLYNVTRDLTMRDGLPLVVWMRNNTEWSCGACFMNAPIGLGGYNFGAQIFIPATARDQSYWSDAVNAHEVGHWTMSSYGTSPGEGGPHQVGCITYPGQAWSEGWATGISSLARGSGRYYDKQDGTFFWFDIDSRNYHGLVMWPRPTPGGGLLQFIDENEVSSMLWSMADNPNQPPLSLKSNGKFFTALSSPRLNNRPFARGYTRHSWVGACQRSNIVDTRISAVMFADFLDALLCTGGIAANRVDAAVDPANHYPYDSANPICK